MDLYSPFFYMEAKFGPSVKRIKKIDISQDEIFQNSRVHHFLPPPPPPQKSNKEILEELKVEPVTE